MAPDTHYIRVSWGEAWPQRLKILGDFSVQLTLGMAIVFLFQPYPLAFSLFISLPLNRKKMQEKILSKLKQIAK